MDQKNPSPSSSLNSSSSSNNKGGGGERASSTPNPNPNPNLNPNSNPYPTTFIQADTQSFKHVVQMLTGSNETTSNPSSTATNNNNNNNKSPIIPPPNPKNPIPPISKPNKKPAFKLYERRSSSKNLKMISPLIPNPNSNPNFRIQQEILSPSILNFPSLVLSPVTPLSPDPFNRSPIVATATSNNSSNLRVSEEEKAIADKKFYLHPSPRNGEHLPKLLPLFPLTSPRMELEKERGH